MLARSSEDGLIQNRKPHYLVLSAPPYLFVTSRIKRQAYFIGLFAYNGFLKGFGSELNGWDGVKVPLRLFRAPIFYLLIL